MDEVYDSSKVKENLENVLNLHAYQHVDAEKELSEMFANKRKVGLNEILLRLSKISQYFEELNAVNESLLAELDGSPVDERGPVKGQADSGILPRLNRLCEYLELQLTNFGTNNEKLKKIIGE